MQIIIKFKTEILISCIPISRLYSSKSFSSPLVEFTDPRRSKPYFSIVQLKTLTERHKKNT